MSQAPQTRALDRERCRYTAFYCEENVWQLAQSAELPGGERHVLFITNEARQTLLWSQRVSPGDFVLWDYHVVLVVEAEGGPLVYDLDSALPFPSPLVEYVRLTFGDPRRVPRALRASFRVVPAQTFVSRFSSDRSHMRGPDGGWLQPPPTWPPIAAPHGNEAWTLADALALTRKTPGWTADVRGLLTGFGLAEG